MEYRKDIQILRGIAVIQVVLVHLDVGYLNSGFLGVDVFFVVSGYLMAVLYDPLDKRKFYEKRARRLLPAYFATILATLSVALIVTTPNDLQQVYSQSLFAVLFASNVGYWMENSYFDNTAFKPLLHLWSLGVEIQFYFLIPFLCAVFRRLKLSYPLLMAASALACFVVVGVSPKTSFFLLPFRLWEFLLGLGVATYAYKGIRETSAHTLWLGAAALAVIIGFPFVSLDRVGLGFLRGHPGLSALFVCLATATVLSFGLPKRIEANPVSDLLEKIGGRSYSIYLAHFPVIVLFLYQPFSGTVLKAASPGQAVTLAALVAISSAVLFEFVERPFRVTGKTLRWSFASAVAVLGIGYLGTSVQKAIIPEQEMKIYQASFDRDEYRCGKLKRIVDPGALSCEVTESIRVPSHRVLLVGNSHADSIKATFAAAAQTAKVAVYFMIENNPLMKGGVTPEQLIDEARARHVDSIVQHYSPNVVDYRVIARLAALAKENNIRLSFIMPVPVWDRHLPMALWKSLKGLGQTPHQDINDYLNFNKNLIRELSNVDYDKFKVYDVANVLCRSDCLQMSDNGKPLYFDSGHLTLTGSKMLRGVFERVIGDLF